MFSMRVNHPVVICLPSLQVVVMNLVFVKGPRRDIREEYSIVESCRKISECLMEHFRQIA